MTIITIKKFTKWNERSLREQKLLENSRSYAKLKDYNFTLHWVRPRLPWLTVQHDPWNFYSTVSWKIMDTSTFRKWLNSLQHWILEEIARKTSYKRVKISDFLHSVKRTTTRIKKKKLKIGDRVCIPKYDSPLRKGYKPRFTQKVLKSVATSSRKPSTYKINDEQDEIILGNFNQEELIKVF